MINEHKTLNRLLNALLAVAGILFVTGLVRLTQARLETPSAPASLAGTQLRIPELASGVARQLIVVLSTTCKFCSAEASLYRALNERAQRSQTGLVFVLPQSADEARAYLAALGVPARDVRSADLAAMGVWGTPTILLVDRNLRIERVWAGRVPEREWPSVLGVL